MVSGPQHASNGNLQVPEVFGIQTISAYRNPPWAAFLWRPRKPFGTWE